MTDAQIFQYMMMGMGVVIALGALGIAHYHQHKFNKDKKGSL